MFHIHTTLLMQQWGEYKESGKLFNWPLFGKVFQRKILQHQEEIQHWHKKKNKKKLNWREDEAFWVHFNLNFMNRTVLWSFYLHHRMFRYTSYTNIILMFYTYTLQDVVCWKTFCHIFIFMKHIIFFFIFFNLNLLLKCLCIGPLLYVSILYLWWYPEHTYVYML